MAEIKENIKHNNSSALGRQGGAVILAAAGCGDPELITVKAAKFLQQADIVLTDRLVSKQILDTYVNKSAQIIHVAKQHKNDNSTAQEDINNLMLKYAQQGKLVVRLKGGDIAFYSNVLDELKVLVENNISYQIIPGVTAASGASAYAGIPLTARGYSTSVRFFTYYKNDIVTDAYWKELANTTDTLVLYMSNHTLDDVVENLVKYKIEETKLLAVIQQATTPLQHVSITNLYHYNNTLKGKAFASPSIVIIGKVVALHKDFSWKKNVITNKLYFTPIN